MAMVPQERNGDQRQHVKDSKRKNVSLSECDSKHSESERCKTTQTGEQGDREDPVSKGMLTVMGGGLNTSFSTPLLWRVKRQVQQ